MSDEPILQPHEIDFVQGFWLSNDGGKTWFEVDKAAWVAAERVAGFRNTMGQPDEPGTASWSNGLAAGTTLRFMTEPGLTERIEAEVAVEEGALDDSIRLR